MKVSVSIHFEDGRTVDLESASYQDVWKWYEEHHEEGIKMIVVYRVEDEEVETD